MRRRITQIMLILIMLFCLTAWTVGGRAPVRPAPEQKAVEMYSGGIKHTGEPRPPVDFPYPVETEVAYP